MSEEKKKQPFVNTFFFELHYFFLIFFLEQATRENDSIACFTNSMRKKIHKKIQLYLENPHYIQASNSYCFISK